jgi:primosomal protein N' (replication factor Y)
MVAKGHDFPKVTLVGVLAADQILGMPDFRASERTFQLLTQVAGRSGRAGEDGLVLVQVFATEHFAVKTAVEQDYDAFYRVEIENRRRLMYPPFTSMIQVIVKDPDVNAAYQTARGLAEFVRSEAGDLFRVMGPAIAPLAKIKDLYRFQVILRGVDRPAMHDRLRELLHLWEERKGPPRRVDPRNVELDVDPLSMM